MQTVARALGRFEKLSETIAIVLLAVMMVLVTFDAGGRYLFLSPIFGTHEFVETYLMVGVVWLGMAQVQAAGGQVSVDLLARAFPAGLRRRLNALFLVIALVVVALVVWRGAAEMGNQFRRQAIIATPVPFTSIPMPVWLSWALLSLGAATLSIRLLIQLLRVLAGLPAVAPQAGDPEPHGF